MPAVEIKPRDFLSEFYSPAEAAAALHVHPHTLKRWRARSYGPKPVRVGMRLYYRKADIESWLGSLGQAPAKAS